LILKFFFINKKILNCNWYCEYNTLDIMLRRPPMKLSGESLSRNVFRGYPKPVVLALVIICTISVAGYLSGQLLASTLDNTQYNNYCDLSSEVNEHDSSVSSSDSPSGSGAAQPTDQPNERQEQDKDNHKKIHRAKSEAVSADELCLSSNSLSLPQSSSSTTSTSQVTDEKKAKEDEKQIVDKYEIIVTAPRLEIPLKKNPAATTVVESSVIENIPRTIGIDEVMKLVPGVKVDNQADGERVHISIRGEGILTERCTRGIRAMVDGVPLTDPSGYVSDFYDIDWSTIRRVEVLRGPAAAFYGSSSSGGIINIFTRDGGPEPFSYGATIVRGGFGLKKAQAGIGGTTGMMNYHLSGSILSGDGYRQHSAYSADNAWGKFIFNLSPRVKITYVAGWTNFFNENPEGLNLAWFMSDEKNLRRLANPDSYTYNEYQRTKRVTNGATAEIKLSDNLDLDALAYYRHTQYREAVPSSVIHRQLDTPGLTIQLNHRSRLGQLGRTDLESKQSAITNYLSFGLDYAYQAIDEFKHPNLGNAVEGPDFQSDQNMYQDAVGVFLLDRVDFGSKWGISGIVRYDHLSNRLEDHLQTADNDLSGKVSYERVTGRVGLTWNPLQNFGLYASWGTGFVPPGTEELVNNPYAYGGYNAELVPATSNGEEIGARGTFGNKLSYDVAVFHIKTKNDFGRYRLPDRPLETFYGNVGSTKRNGVETSITWAGLKNLVIQAAYTYYHFKYEEVDTLTGETLYGTWVPNIPQHELYVDGQYRLTERFSVGAAVEYVSAWYIDATNRILPNGYGRTDPYTLVNFRAAYQFEFRGTPFEVRLSGRNIFNELYYGFTEPDPDGNSYQPAPTAEWSLGVRLGF
jgi:iron complex outermembrane receptor protein